MLKIQLIRSMHTDLERIHGTTNKCIVGIYGQYTDSELVSCKGFEYSQYFNIECLRITSLNVITYRYVYFPCIILTLYLVLTCFLSNSMFILLMLFAFFPFLAFAQLH